MTSPLPQLMDAANPLLAQGPYQLDTGTVWAQGGTQLAVLTFRTASTSLTMFLLPAELRKWSAVLSGLAASLSESGLIAAGPGTVIAGG